MASTAESPLLEARYVNIVRKRKTILDNVNFTLKKGEIHALVGDHHSGKTALADLFVGAETKTSGELLVKGKSVAVLTPKTAGEMGIAMLHQNSVLIPNLNVAENVFLGSLPRLLNGRSLFTAAKELLARVGSTASPGDRTADLPQMERNLVELAALIANQPGVVILDEVSKRFNPEEMERVYEIIGRIRSERGGVVFISTSIDEIYDFADRVTILRDGGCRGTEDVKRTDKAELLNRTYSFVVSRESLRKSNIELQNYKKYNERILQNLPVGIIILDPNLRIHFMNHTATGIIAPGASDMQFKTIPDLPEPMVSLLSSPDLIDELVKFQHRDRLVQATSFPFDDDEGEVLGMILLLEDITNETQMKEHLIRAERLKSTAALASSLAHEINNPLCIMRNYLELAIRAKLPGDSRECLDKVGSELNHIVGIVNNLLPFSRQQETVRRPVNLNRLVAETAELMRIGAKDRNIVLDHHAPDEELNVQGSENNLKQVLVNLIANAIEAGDETAGVHIDVFLAREGESAIVGVVDDGPGIPDDIAAKIYDPFFSSKASKKNTGLGLTICQHIVESHGGLVSHRRLEDRTEFSFRLPISG